MKYSKYEIFELKNGNIKLSNVLKYDKVKLVFAVFASACTELALNYIEQAPCD